MNGALKSRYLIIDNSAGGIDAVEAMRETDKNGMFYLSSEESAIRLISPGLNRIWKSVGDELVIGKLGKPLPPQRELAFAGVM
jgi:hypothetical protein